MTFGADASFNADSRGLYFYANCGIEKWSGYGPSLVAENGLDFEISDKTNRANRTAIITASNISSYIGSGYLALSGGTMSGIISRDAGGSWISARDNVVIKTIRTSNEGSDWHPAVGIKTSSGFWSFGSVGGEHLGFSYDTDANYNVGNNSSTVINIPRKAGTLALTSDIPSTISISNVSGLRDCDRNIIIGSTGCYSNGTSSARLLRLGLGTVGHTGSQYWSFCVDDRTSNSYLQIGYTSSDVHFSLRHDGVGTFAGGVYSNSDRHLKKNIQNIDILSLECLFDISDKLLKKFTWKQTGKDSYGFIAQEIEKYIPEAITEDPNNIKSVSCDIAYAKILAAIIHRIKQIESR